MSPTSDGRRTRFTYHVLNRRTVKEIEERVTEKGKRNRAYRLFHARNDKETIASWRSDLIRIIGVFNVCPVVYVWLLLTATPQAEVAIDTNANTSGTRQDVANTHIVVSSIQDDVVKTHNLVSDIHHNMQQIQGWPDQHNSVSEAVYLSTSECLSFPRPQSG